MRYVSACPCSVYAYLLHTLPPRQDVCLSVWFGRNLEIKLKVTDVIPEGTPGFGPKDLRVEPYIWNSYLAKPLANNLTFWTFTKCWGNAVLQPRYTYLTQQPSPVRDHLFPWFKSCFPWCAPALHATQASMHCVLFLCVFLPSLTTVAHTMHDLQGALSVRPADHPQPRQ